MSYLSRSVISAFFGVFLLQACDNSSDVSAVVGPALTQSEAAAIAALEAHMVGRNANDAKQVADANNYPFARIGLLGQVIYYDNYENFWKIQEYVVIPGFISDPVWHHSVWDELKVVQSSPSKVHIAATFSRVDAGGDRYITTDTFWIVTEQEGHWATKMKSSFLEEAGQDRTGVDEAEAAALGVVESYFDRLNNRDSESLAQLIHYPLVFLNDLDLTMFRTPEEYISYIENSLVKDLDYAGWSRSELKSVKVLQSSPLKVHLAIQSDHINVGGDVISQHEGLWVITIVEGRWAIIGQSLL